MRKLLSLALGMICSTAAMSAQTADELVGKNLEAETTGMWSDAEAVVHALDP